MKFIIHFQDGHIEECKAVRQNSEGYIFEAISMMRAIFSCGNILTSIV